MEQELIATIDNSEPFQMFEDFADHPEVDDIEIEELKAGDVEIFGIGFERKTMSDYASSVLDGRIKEQSKKLGQMYEYAYVLIDGNLNETENRVHTNMKPESLRGSMCSLTARENSGVVSVIPCSKTDLLADMAVRIARKHIEEESSPYLPTGAVSSDHSNTEMMFGCIDGVGAMMAQDLHEQYSTIGDLCENATVESLCEIDGIGETTAKKIINSVV